MSEYQYYEFCNTNKPMTAQARQEMKSLSSRSKLTTHGVSYVYNYGDFRGEPEELLARHFDVYFYIANWGTLRLIFKYKTNEVDSNNIKPYLIDNVINCKICGEFTILEIEINDENCGWGWIEGKEMLGDLLPLYEEIKYGNYNLLLLVAIIHATYNEVNDKAINSMYNELSPLSIAQWFLLKSIDFQVKA
jgi:hypothetical protein